MLVFGISILQCKSLCSIQILCGCVPVLKAAFFVFLSAHFCGV